MYETQLLGTVNHNGDTHNTNIYDIHAI